MKYKIGILLFSVMIAAGIVFLCLWLGKARQEQQPYQALLKTVHSIDENIDKISEPLSPSVQDTANPIDFPALSAINGDIMGWISNNDLIDYPVVATQDESYYLTHDFYGEYNRAGTPFLIGGTSMPGDEEPLVIHGHNMGQGRNDIFSSLLNYKEREYFEKFPAIIFDTPQEHRTYYIFAAFQLDVQKDIFPYTQKTFSDAREYQCYVNAAIERTPYGTNVVPGYGNHIIVLSTCDRSVNRNTGRYIVIAARAA